MFNTRQARILEGETTTSVQVAASLGVLELCGAGRYDVDGIVGSASSELAYRLGIGPVWASSEGMGIAGVLEAANAIAAGVCETALVVGGTAGILASKGDATAPWVRAANEFVLSVGMYTAVEFALIARRHMAMYGTQPEHLARVSSTIRNNGHINPEAVYYGRGPYSPEDILASRMVADPFHLLDCAMTAEGGVALLVTTAERARDLKLPPVYLLGAGIDVLGPAYTHPPAWDLASFDHKNPSLGLLGQRAAERAFAMGGATPNDVDCAELYDPFSFEIIRQLEAYGFCKPGEGGDFVMDGNIDPDGSLPVNTDGGLLSFSHTMTGQTHQKVGRSIQQIQGTCPTVQVENAEVVLCSVGGAGASFCQVALLGKSRP